MNVMDKKPQRHQGTKINQILCLVSLCLCGSLFAKQAVDILVCDFRKGRFETGSSRFFFSFHLFQNAIENALQLGGSFSYSQTNESQRRKFLFSDQSG